MDDPRSHRKSVLFSDDGAIDIEEGYSAPILAEDEVEKNPPAYDQPPAVELPPERRSSVGDEPSSRPTSRPASLYKEVSFEHQSTPLEDVEEYEPLFPEDEKADSVKKAKAEEAKNEHKQRFPSRDIWEDAPNSVHYTAEVSTPDLPEESQDRPTPVCVIPTQRTGETPAQAFARHQEELAEREVRQRGPDGFLPGNAKQKPSWIQHQQHVAKETSRPGMNQRFPSRDVWEDPPDSLKLETTVSSPQVEIESPQAESKPGIPQRPRRKSSEPTSATSEKEAFNARASKTPTHAQRRRQQACYP